MPTFDVDAMSDHVLAGYVSNVLQQCDVHHHTFRDVRAEVTDALARDDWVGSVNKQRLKQEVRRQLPPLVAAASADTNTDMDDARASPPPVARAPKKNSSCG